MYFNKNFTAIPTKHIKKVTWSPYPNKMCSPIRTSKSRKQALSKKSLSSMYNPAKTSLALTKNGDELANDDESYTVPGFILLKLCN